MLLTVSPIAIVGAALFNARLAEVVTTLGGAYLSLPPSVLFVLVLLGSVWSAASVVWNELPCPLTIDIVLVVILIDASSRLLSGTRYWFEFYNLQYVALAIGVLLVWARMMIFIGGRLIAIGNPAPTEAERTLLRRSDPFGDPHAQRILAESDTESDDRRVDSSREQ